MQTVHLQKKNYYQNYLNSNHSPTLASDMKSPLAPTSLTYTPTSTMKQISEQKTKDISTSTPIIQISYPVENLKKPKNTPKKKVTFWNTVNTRTQQNVDGTTYLKVPQQQMNSSNKRKQNFLETL